MPKTPIRAHAPKAATQQVSLPDVHCRHLNRDLQNASNEARLRGSLQLGFLVVRPRRRQDSLFQRMFRQKDISEEKLVARAALASAANNMSPKRLGQLGSPGQRAVQTLYTLSSAGMRSDIRVGQVRGAVTLLAGTRKKRSFNGTPVKSRASKLGQNGATGLGSAENVRRVQLNRFCMDSAASGGLLACLADTGDATGSVAASLSIFRAAAQSFILEALLAGKPAPQEAIARQVQKGMDSPLLRLFIALWRRATAAGKIAAGMFPWFDAVDWLVGAMHVVRLTSPGTSRVPKSPRLTSPAALMLRRAQAATSVPPLAARAPAQGTSPVTVSGNADRHLRSRTVTHAGRGRLDQPDSPFKAAPRPARQRQNVQMRYRPPVPPVPAESVAARPATVTNIASNAAMHAAVGSPAPGLTGDSPNSPNSPINPISPGGRILAGATLGDIVHHLARTTSTNPGTDDAGNGTPGLPDTVGSNGELSPGYRQ